MYSFESLKHLVDLSFLHYKNVKTLICYKISHRCFTRSHKTNILILNGIFKGHSLSYSELNLEKHIKV